LGGGWRRRRLLGPHSEAPPPSPSHAPRVFPPIFWAAFSGLGGGVGGSRRRASLARMHESQVRERLLEGVAQHTLRGGLVDTRGRSRLTVSMHVVVHRARTEFHVTGIYFKSCIHKEPSPRFRTPSTHAARVAGVVAAPARRPRPASIIPLARRVRFVALCVVPAPCLELCLFLHFFLQRALLCHPFYVFRVSLFPLVVLASRRLLTTLHRPPSPTAGQSMHPPPAYAPVPPLSAPCGTL